MCCAFVSTHIFQDKFKYTAFYAVEIKFFFPDKQAIITEQDKMQHIIISIQAPDDSKTS